MNFLHHEKRVSYNSFLIAREISFYADYPRDVTLHKKAVLAMTGRGNVAIDRKISRGYLFRDRCSGCAVRKRCTVSKKTFSRLFATI